MNIDYKQWNAFEEGTDQFRHVLQTQPLVCDLYDRTRKLVEDSPLNGKVSLSLYVFKNSAWFTMWPQMQSSETVNQYRNNPIPFENLLKQIEARYVDVLEQSIKIPKKGQQRDFKETNYA